MKINWGKELSRVSGEQDYDPGMLTYIRNEMKRNVLSGGNPFDGQCAGLFKYFVIATVWWQARQSGDTKLHVDLYGEPAWYLDFEKVKSEAILK